MNCLTALAAMHHRRAFSGSIRTGWTQLLLPGMHRASCPLGMSVILLDGTGVVTFIQTLRACLPSPWSTLRAALRFPVGSHVQCDLVTSLWKGSVGVRGLCLLVPPVSHSAWVLACICAASSPRGQRTQRGPQYWQ